MKTYDATRLAGISFLTLGILAGAFLPQSSIAQSPHEVAIKGDRAAADSLAMGDLGILSPPVTNDKQDSEVSRNPRRNMSQLIALATLDDEEPIITHQSWIAAVQSEQEEILHAMVQGLPRKENFTPTAADSSRTAVAKGQGRDRAMSLEK